MSFVDKKSQQHEFRERVVREILKGQTPGTLQSAAETRAARRVATLERQAPDIVTSARTAGADVQYIGIAPLFAETRLYAGIDTDWVLAPVSNKDDAVVPRKEHHALQRLVDAHIDFPLTYIAHEVTKDATTELPAPPPGGHVVVEPSVGKALVGPVPMPRESVGLSQRLDHRSRQVLAATARAGRAAGTAAAVAALAPVALVGGALASLAALDPIILGAIPALAPQSGEPAAWFVLARWDW